MSPFRVTDDAFGAGNAGADETLVIVDHRIPDSEYLLAALAVPNIAKRVGPDDDGLERLREAAEKFPGRPVILICHGAPGALILGKRTVTADDVRGRRKTVLCIRRALAGAPVSLFACSVGEGPAGRTFLAMLATGFDAPVSAASGPVGDAEKGGSWILDVTVPTGPGRLPPGGRPESWPFDPAMLPAYRHLLANAVFPTVRPGGANRMRALSG